MTLSDATSVVFADFDELRQLGIEVTESDDSPSEFKLSIHIEDISYINASI